MLLALPLVCGSLGEAEGRAQPADGARLYSQRCGGCHSLDANRVGPRHRGLIGRRAGSVPDFRYSAALARAEFAWSRVRLDRWLRDPRAMVPGTTMGVRLSDPTERRAIIDYLASED
ncbi:c-type cytochrome [Parasphingopyxis algicola]|nr:c-type cytochrome [Parasphingopyxis algicola]